MVATVAGGRTDPILQVTVPIAVVLQKAFYGPTLAVVDKRKCDSGAKGISIAASNLMRRKK
jgi:hypothetical protein